MPEATPQAGSRVLVIGGGPAGMAAAVAAGRAGAEVTLVEASSALGGQFALAGRAPRTARRLRATARTGRDGWPLPAWRSAWTARLPWARRSPARPIA